MDAGRHRRHAPCGHCAAAPLLGLARVVGLCVGVVALIWTCAGRALAEPALPERAAVVLTLEGAIGPAAADYVRRGLARAHADGAAAVVLRLDTPGGLDASMREIIRDILASPLPVLGWVGPSGARAASAGTFILYASHVAAMAPGTNLGAATPVALGGGATPAPAGSAASAPANASAAKALNDAVAYIRSLAELRGRDAGFAERAVREAASLPAHEALARRVIDLMAEQPRVLLDRAHGREVKMAAGTVRLDSRGLALRHAEPDWRTRLLSVITDPNLALILLMIGVYGLLFEFMNPGALLPGVLGGISLLVGLYALSALPLDYAGAALLLLGMALMVAEAFSPSFGALGIGGAIAFVLGASLLVDTDVPGYTVSLPLVSGIALAALAGTVLVVRLALAARRQRVVSGTEAMVGASAVVLDWVGDAGHVFVAGERWRADGATDLRPGQTVTVRSVRDLRVTVSSPDIPPPHTGATP